MQPLLGKKRHQANTKVKINMSSQSSKSVTDAIAGYKMSCCLGDFATAEEILSKLPELDLLEPQIASEIVNMRVRQGAFSSAARLLDKVLALQGTEGDAPILHLLAVQRQYLSIYLEGNLTHAAALSESLWRKYFENQEEVSVSETTVCPSLCLFDLPDSYRVLLPGNSTLASRNWRTGGQKTAWARLAITTGEFTEGRKRASVKRPNLWSVGIDWI